MSADTNNRQAQLPQLTGLRGLAAAVVFVSHAAIVNRLLWMQDTYPLGVEDVVLQKTPSSFDVSVWEFFWPLMVGARLAIARPGGHQDPDYLSAFTVGDQLLWGAAEPLRRMLRIVLAHEGGNAELAALSA